MKFGPMLLRAVPGVMLALWLAALLAYLFLIFYTAAHSYFTVFDLVPFDKMPERVFFMAFLMLGVVFAYLSSRFIAVRPGRLPLFLIMVAAYAPVITLILQNVLGFITHGDWKGVEAGEYPAAWLLMGAGYLWVCWQNFCYLAPKNA